VGGSKIKLVRERAVISIFKRETDRPADIQKGNEKKKENVGKWEI
jgi:hypothetical protein